MLFKQMFELSNCSYSLHKLNCLFNDTSCWFFYSFHLSLSLSLSLSQDIRTIRFAFAHNQESHGRRGMYERLQVRHIKVF